MKKLNIFIGLAVSVSGFWGNLFASEEPEPLKARSTVTVEITQEQSYNQMLVLNMDTGKIIPLGEMWETGSPCLWLFRMETKSQRQSRWRQFFDKRRPWRFGPQLCVSNMDIMFAPTDKNQNPIRDFWREKDASNFPLGIWRKTSNYQWDIPPDRNTEILLFRFYDGTAGVLRIADTDHTKVVLEYKILTRSPRRTEHKPNPAIVHFPDGSYYEIAAVSPSPSGPDTWFRPDGTPYPRQPYICKTPLFGSSRSGRKSYEFLIIQCSNQKGHGTAYRWGFKKNQGSGSGSVEDEFGNTLHHHRLSMEGAAFEGDPQTAELSLGIANGPWTTVLATADGNVETTFENRYVKILPPKALEDTKNEREPFEISCIRSDTWRTYSTRMEMITPYKKHIHFSERGQEGFAWPIRRNETTYRCWNSFPDQRTVSLDDVQEFHFQYRPFQKAVIRNISLRPEQDFGVQAEFLPDTEEIPFAKLKKLDKKNCSDLFQVSEILYRSSRPNDQGLKELVQMKIKTIVDLEPAQDNQDRPQTDGLNNISLPMETCFPDRGQIKHFLEIMAAPDNWPVLIHCKNGIDRTGIMTACYRIIVQGWEIEEAIEQISQEPYDFGSQENILKFFRQLDIKELRQELNIVDPKKQ
ncbi:MAG: tyrosine-protein phosphatase [Planctomycetota bacterium]